MDIIEENNEKQISEQSDADVAEGEPSADQGDADLSEQPQEADRPEQAEEPEHKGGEEEASSQPVQEEPESTPSEQPPEPEATTEEPAPPEESAGEEQPAEVEEAPIEEAPEEPEPAVSEEEAVKKVRVIKSRADKVAVLPEEDEAEKKWYVVHAHSGYENKVKQSLENRVKQEHLENMVSQILIPSEEVAEVKGGKKRVTSRKIFPGYVLVEMKLTHKTWYLIRTTAGVTGFIGSGKLPTPLEPEEVESIFQQMRGEQKKPKPKVSFEKDEKVKIIEGPFTNFMGYVDEVNPERGKLKVMVEIFERLTPVELEFWQVEKV
ncbi:MAG: transcription termination/antitermination factor NusG [Candidatus Abyssobacteria bacterium SURF_17]|uniref:Transcription termination/antitermination protein NusG n=1 Tax=Candidatus Abyssobacteria bacterium SURF_17 TaxID=2093361 RepID=A0A419F8Q3_9BACT|nr:MAG: transcription termination/antitermination factor NusG [Candidatus Abyssubacteria bacterium SURF_17]